MIRLFARVRLPEKLMLLAVGRLTSAGKIVRYPPTPWGTTVTFAEIACAFAGTPHCPATVKSLVDTPASDGPPNGPAVVRVSITRQGVSVLKPAPAVPDPGVGVAVGVRVGVGVAVRAAVGVLVGVGVEVSPGVAIGVWVEVGVALGATVGV